MNKFQFDHGVVNSVKDSIVNVSGLYKVSSGELIRDDHNNYGLALNLEKTRVGIVMFTEKQLKSGTLIYRTYKLASIKTGFFLMSNVLDVLGNQLNLGYMLKNNNRFTKIFSFFEFIGLCIRDLELKAPGILVRESVYETVNTGVKVIDGLIPLGQGQRELIIGDRQTGKTTVGLDSMMNQSKIKTIYLD